jgi:mono/diheme cytochrome c family protein
MRFLKLGVALGSGGLLVAGLAYYLETQPESSPYTRGARLAEVSGCYACHGTSDIDPRVNFRLEEDSWQPTDIEGIWEEEHTAKSLRTWITRGVPASREDKHRKLLMQMPAYGDDGHLSPSEIEDVVTWAVAMGLRSFAGYDNFEEEMPGLDQTTVAALPEEQLVLLGDRLARQQGCYQCHGELGQGGPGNLASLKGYIPGFQGEDFRELTGNSDPVEIRHWIEHGRGLDIESGLLGPIAQYFIEGQAIPMPAYGDVMSTAEVDLLVAYLQWLNRQGPLDAAGMEKVGKLIADQL